MLQELTGFSESAFCGLDETFPSRIFGSNVMILCLMFVPLNQALTRDDSASDTCSRLEHDY